MLHYTCPPVVGGVESVLATHARLFAHEAYPVIVIAGRGSTFHRRVAVKRVPEIDSRYPRLLQINDALAHGVVSDDFLKLADTIEALLGEIFAELDVCIIHNALTLHFHLPLTLALHRLANRARCRLIAWCHDLSWTNPLYLPLMRSQEPWTLLARPAAAVRYVAVSEARRDDLQRLLGDDASVRTIINGIDTAGFLGVGQPSLELIEQLQAGSAFPLLLLPARITRRKNIELAIRITAAMKELGARPLLLVTGPTGPHDVRSVDYLSELERLRDELDVVAEVVFVHTMRRPDGRPWRPSDAMMADLYKVCDALLFPSAQEGFGLPLLEAGLVRLPIFCSNIPPFREIAGENVEYFELDDPPGVVARRMLETLERPGPARLRRTISARYAWSEIFQAQLRPLVDAALEAQPAARDRVATPLSKEAS